MMREPLGRPQRAWAVRENIFSFLLAWEKVMAQLSKYFLTGDFTEWPLDQGTACEICRVRCVRGQESVVDKYAELKVRSRVVKDMANIYIERHVYYLGNRSHVLKLHPAATKGNLREQFRIHIEERVDEVYPRSEFGGTDGAVPSQIRFSLTDSVQNAAQKPLHVK